MIFAIQSPQDKYFTIFNGVFLTKKLSRIESSFSFLTLKSNREDTKCAKDMRRLFALSASLR